MLVEEQDFPDGVSSVTVFAGGGFCNVENHGANTPEQVLGSVADAMANYGCITLGQSAVVLSPEHVRIISGAGWSRAQVKEYLFTQAYRTVDGLKSVGKFRQREYDKQHADGGTSSLSSSKDSSIAVSHRTTFCLSWAAAMRAVIRALSRHGAGHALP